MSIQYKNYPIKIDGGSVKDDFMGIFSSKSVEVLNYEKKVSAILDTIIKLPNGVGQMVFNSFPKDKQIVIVPYKSEEFDNKFGTCNALASDATVFERGVARVRFTPFIFQAGGICLPEVGSGLGAQVDQILLHELLHTYRKVRGTFNRIPLNKDEKHYDDIEEFFAIIITNIYMSENGYIKFRNDHSDFEPLPAKWASSEKFIEDKDFFHWVEYFWLMEKPLVPLLANSTAHFNPFRAYKGWLDNKHRIATTSW